MKIKCNIDTYRGVKNGMKVVLHLNKDQKKLFQRFLNNFEDMPLDVDFQIDADKRRKMLSMITEPMRNMIHAIFKDIAQYTGDNPDSVKEDMKNLFLEGNEKYTYFSLSNCDKGLAKDFINYLVAWCLKHGVILSQHPKEIFDHIEDYMYMCLKLKKCVICGQPAELAHIDSIGMGRDRRTVDDSKNLKMALCGEHHRTGPTSIHNIGVESFCEMYHVIGIIFNG